MNEAVEEGREREMRGVRIRQDYRCHGYDWNDDPGSVEGEMGCPEMEARVDVYGFY